MLSWHREITQLWFATRADSQQGQLCHTIISPPMTSTKDTAADKLIDKINSRVLEHVVFNRNTQISI